MRRRVRVQARCAMAEACAMFSGLSTGKRKRALTWRLARALLSLAALLSAQPARCLVPMIEISILGAFLKTFAVPV